MTSYEPLAARTPAATTHRDAVRFVALHNAVRRDLVRLVRVLGEPVTAVRRAALSQHVGFLLDQLQDCHVLLDRAIGPALTRRQPDLAERVEGLERAHRELAGRALLVREDAQLWRRTGDAADRNTLRDSVAGFTADLEQVIELDHELLGRACDELAVADWVQTDRWMATRRRPTVLARRLFWLLDELDAAQRAALLDRTPRAAMWVLRNGFSGAYNRSSYLMWTGGGNGPAV